MTPASRRSRAVPAGSGAPGSASAGPPPLRPFGLVLHHDGRWSHEGQPILHRPLREHFDRSVKYLVEEAKYVVTLRHFRGEIEVEEAGFFVRTVDLDTGMLTLSDRSQDPLDPATITLSPIDGAMLCRVKRDLVPGGLPARFTHAAQAELVGALDEDADGYFLRIGGTRAALPGLVSED